MHIDIYELNLNYPGWQDDLDAITGEMRGEVIAWAFMQGFDELVSCAVFEMFWKNNEQSCRRDTAEWLMNLFNDNRGSDPWIKQTQDMLWNYGRETIYDWLIEEDGKHVTSMSIVDDLASYKEERDAGA